MQLPALDRYERAPLSSETLSILLDFAAGDPAQPLTTTQVDWAEVFQGVCRNALTGVTYRYLLANPAIVGIPDAFRADIKKAHTLQVLRMAVLNRQIGQVLRSLNEASVPYLIVKGPAVANSVFPDPSLRTYNDLDLVVRERDWVGVHDLLSRLGYQLEDGQPAPPPKLIPSAVTYEIKYRSPQGLRVEVHYEDILNAGLAARGADGFWERSIQLCLDNSTPFPALCLEDQLVHLCAHAHYHGYVRLNWFTDILFYLRDKAHELNWERFLATVRTEEAQVPVYYTFQYVGQLFGVPVPKAVLQAVRPDSFRRKVHDWLMPPAEILSFQPMPRADFSFYFLPLYKRLLPDLLVMGRRRDKLAYLLRLLAPPPDWLRCYYNLGGGWIGFHYLLHPLRLAGVYLRETLQVVLRRRLYE